ncbi:binding-protein-dependent transport systems inner membrane component [Allomeiothermus silvanus DSM 9946]|uniref:Binding-protein-dependent transport systems inner membrane component n=1 Tax=Allomeiothermus silvanus (strain ATCC 700542 / DSM 9946 / NBRC 106475 / NCIMB 13440 / VI-R2) TaxID=526227 RepID=D7BGA5_ALLS1|nr:ABC transporter permease [Allomeiothermus silvanus]ADH62026.1 binding-protein-dependent transport systems inner membrane component [Allomeiothermus silvanus DSM 9946]
MRSLNAERRAPKAKSLWAKLPPSGKIGGFILTLILLMVVASALNPVDPNATTPNRLSPPSLAHPLGTDILGRDTLARVLAGAENALYVGLVAVGIGLSLGLVLGVIAGYFGGWLDQGLSVLLETLYALPALLIALLLAAIFNPGVTTSMVAIGLAAVPAFARVARASVLSVKAQPYIEAAKALGMGPLRIMLRHVLPNILGPLVVQASLAFAAAILAEAALSYLGLGTQPPNPSWGRMLREAQSYQELTPFPVIFPGMAIGLAVLGFNLLGDGLRDWLDPRQRSQ